jgi:pseudaminic acid biosynthesis-associated methylase
MVFNTEQEEFWAKKYAEDYINKNSDFDHELGAKSWAKMLEKTNGNINRYLECGCNIGKNIEQLSRAMPDARASIIEISKPAFDFVTHKYDLEYAFNGAIIDADAQNEYFDLVFTMGVLIHIHPDHLIEHMRKMYGWSRKYILIGEYFNRTPTMIEYQGEKDKLFKSDFGKTFIDNFDVTLLDYGFWWGYIYDKAGLADITWWLFEKN